MSIKLLHIIYFLYIFFYPVNWIIIKTPPAPTGGDQISGAVIQHQKDIYIVS